MKFTIKRSKWLRGTDNGKLLDKAGMQCCIGQACSQLGVPNETLLGVGTINRLGKHTNLDPLFDHNTLYEEEWVERAYGVNDNPRISDHLREKKLKELAASGGHEFVFVD